MENKKWTRRQVLGSMSVLPLAANAPLISFSTISQKSSKDARCKILQADGEPIEVDKMDRFYICDLLSRPFQIDPRFAPGEIVFAPVTKPFRIGLPVMVPGFGEVFLYADNRGKGYTAGYLEDVNILFLNYEFAADRLATVNMLKEECESSRITLSSETLQRIASAEHYFTRTSETKGDDRAAAKWAFESLRESLWAGEMIVLERAEQIIERRGSRQGFLFGCNAFRFRDYGSPHTRLFESLFNFGTLPFYMGSIQKALGKPEYSRVDGILEAMQHTHIVPKGHPLIFLVPDSPGYVRNRPYEEIKQICLDYIRHTVQTFRGRIHIWDVINEAHVQPDIQYGEAIIQGYTKEKAIDLSCCAAKAAREADPTCYRIINCTGTWGDYYMGRKPAPWQQTAYDYLQMVEDAPCEYEAIGLQYYHSGRDLLEIERNLKMFSRFNKPIHITELQIPSSSADIAGRDWWGGGAGGARFPWHGMEFTETIQADWVESVYKLLYSKSYIDAITWWDMADPAFVPHGGLVHADKSPKESYFRLKNLLDKWKALGSE